jgi:hypothetical protein
MLEAAFNWIKDQVAPTQFQKGASTFVDKSINKVVDDVPRVAALHATSLSGVIDYLNTQAEKDLCGGEVFVHVSTPEKVFVISSVFGETRQRDVFLISESEQSSLKTDRWMSTEEMIIHLATHFQENEDSKGMIKLLSSLVGSTVVQKADDGLSEQVEIKTGITTKEKVEVKPIRVLKPYRTFSEVEPCEERFLLRIRKEPRNEASFEAKLIEADGLKWMEDAKSKIKNYITSHIEDIEVIF